MMRTRTWRRRSRLWIFLKCHRLQSTADAQLSGADALGIDLHRASARRYVMLVEVGLETKEVSQLNPLFG